MMSAMKGCGTAAPPTVLNRIKRIGRVSVAPSEAKWIERSPRLISLNLIRLSSAADRNCFLDFSVRYPEESVPTLRALRRVDSWRLFTRHESVSGFRRLLTSALLDHLSDTARPAELDDIALGIGAGTIDHAT